MRGFGMLMLVGVLFTLTCVLGSHAAPLDTPEAENGTISYRMNVTCGDKVCEMGENVYNCPEDCSTAPITYNTNFINPRVVPGTTKQYSLNVRNILPKRPVNVSVSINGQLTQYLVLTRDEARIPPGNNTIIPLQLGVSQNSSQGTVEGEIVIRTQGHVVRLPRVLTITNVGQSMLEMNINVLTDTVSPDDKLKVQHELYSYQNEPISVNLSYTIKAADSEEVYDTLDESRVISGSDIYIRDIPINDTHNGTLPENKYFLELSARQGGASVTTSDSFVVNTVFWTRARIRIGISVVGLLIAAGLFLYGRRKYIEWKIARMRYLMPDFEKLPKRGDRSLPVGKIPETTKRAYIDPDNLTTHALVAGSTGAGKSVNASIIVEEILELNIPAIVFDPTSQWTGFVKQCSDSNVLNFYKHFGMKEDEAHPYKGLIYNVTSPEVDIDVEKYMNPGEVTVFNMNALQPGEYDQAVQRIIDKMFTVQWEESPELRMVIVFDECHRLLEKYGGQGGYIALEKACREFRKWGIGLVMVSQVNADFKQAVAGNILTEVQLNTKSMPDINKVAQKYGLDYSSKVTRMGIGVAMVQNPKYNEGKPWFIHFRPPYHNPHKISEEELEKYSRYSTELDQVEEKLKKAEQQGKNVSEIMMELNLTRDKLKEGHFKMVDIYLESLKESANKL